MDCCLTAPSHYLNQCWLISTRWLSSEGNLPEIHQSSITKFSAKITHLKFYSTLPWANELRWFSDEYPILQQPLENSSGKTRPFNGRDGNNFEIIIFELIYRIDILRNSYEIVLWRRPKHQIHDKSTLTWCRQAISHYLSQCWHRYLSPYGVTMPQWVKTMHDSERSETTAC